MEVYNEEIRDLLSDGSSTEKLEVRQGGEGGGNHVPGLQILEVVTITVVPINTVLNMKCLQIQLSLV